MGSVNLYSVLIYMLLSEDVTYASNVFETYVIVIIWKLCCFLIDLEIQTCIIICELFYNIISAANLHVFDVYLLNHAILVYRCGVAAPLAAAKGKNIVLIGTYSFLLLFFLTIFLIRIYSPFFISWWQSFHLPGSSCYTIHYPWACQFWGTVRATLQWR